MGSPAAVIRAIRGTEKASELATLKGPASVELADGRATIPFTLPRQGVSLLVLEW